jgi:hypothetical protein
MRWLNTTWCLKKSHTTTLVKYVGYVNSLLNRAGECACYVCAVHESVPNQTLVSVISSVSYQTLATLVLTPGQPQPTPLALILFDRSVDLMTHGRHFLNPLALN